MKFKSEIRKLKFEIGKDQIIQGELEFVNSKKLILHGKVERINGTEFNDYAYFTKPDLNEKTRILPMKLSLTASESQQIEGKILETISFIVEFWSREAVVLSIKSSAFNGILSGEVDAIIGKPYNMSYAKHCEFSFEFDINSNSIAILESKNIPGMKDVIK